ncbi:Callose synthase 10 [Platanthera zijinensis]|uniref:Callose synthase 10 n=1 Tax=Platanthera zijinensis TaxID=2320716 RepID=A0AAP0G0E3_9ASPA
MTVYENWERLVRAMLEREQLRSVGERPGQCASGLAGAVPPSLGRTTNIDAILQAADEFKDDDPNVWMMTPAQTEKNERNKHKFSFCFKTDLKIILQTNISFRFAPKRKHLIFFVLKQNKNHK